MRERFTMGQMVGMEDPGSGEATESKGGGGESVADFLDWDLPEGWKQVSPTDIRVINLRFGDGDAAECYLALLRGGGGGLDANIGRWYGQMGQDAPGADVIAALPRKLLLGRMAVEIDLEGTYAPGMGSPPKSDSRMVGRILPPSGPQGDMFSMFLKMTGPADVVEQNIEKFEQFCESLAPKQ